MSLINEALKKAQRLRLEQQAGAAADAPAGEIRKRARPMRAQTIVLLIAGATVLVVFSVVITVYLLNSEDDSGFTPTVIVNPPTSTPLVAPAAPSPVIVAPAIAHSSSTPSPAPSLAPAVTNAAPPAIVVPESVATASPTPATASTPSVTMPSTSSAPATADAPPTATTPAASPQAAAAAAKLAEVVDAIAPDPDVRAQQFIDTLRVTGIRASGEDSKVLMNDRVYRVNDIVDRTLGLRLIKVAPDSLTFSDPAGTTYTKIF